MNKAEFIGTLKSHLGVMPATEIDDILYDYDEHFRIGLEQGKTEEVVAEALGNPKAIAKQYRVSFLVEKAQTKASTGNVLRAVIGVISLGFFNLVFVLGPFIGLLGVLIGVFAAALGITVAGLALIVVTLAYPLVSQYVVIPGNLVGQTIGLLALGTGLTSLGLLFFLGDCFLAKYVFQGTIKYLQMNVRIINGGKEK